MYLERVGIVHYGPFEDLDLGLVDDAGEPRLLVVVYGEGGTGKSTIVEAMANTRPGRATPLPPHRRRDGDRAHVICDWRLGLEDPERPHPLRVVSPNVRIDGDGEQARRREQSHFDRVAAHGPGFVFVDIPSQRYFSRASLGLNDPARIMARYDTRGQMSGYESSRLDLTRPCKQALSYAAINAALAAHGPGTWGSDGALGQAMYAAVRAVTRLAGYDYLGVDPRALETVFETSRNTRVLFDGLPTLVRHLIAFVAIPLRACWAGHGGLDPRVTECVVAIDDFDVYATPAVVDGLFAVLQQAMPRAQWILTTGSPYAAAAVDPGSLVTLRRQPDTDAVAVYRGELALTH